MKKYKELGIYDFSDYAEEITGEELIKINGGSSSCNGSGPGNGGSSAASGGSGSKGSGSSSIGASSGSCGGSPSVPSGSSGNSSSGFSTSGSGSGSAPSSGTGSCGGSISSGTPSGYNPGPDGVNITAEVLNNIQSDNWTNHVPLQNQAAAKEYYERTTQRNEYYIKKYNINPYLPTDIKIKLVQKELDHQFALAVSSYIGTDYVFGGKSRKGIDCSGTITESLKDMGYRIENKSVSNMVNGKVDWLTILPYHSEKIAGNEGIINFYKLEDNDGQRENINHVNVGVGSSLNHPEDLSIYSPQIVDATESDWMCSRNSDLKQYIPAQAAKVNQTYAPFSTNEESYPVVQARINWEVLDEKYHK